MVLLNLCNKQFHYLIVLFFNVSSFFTISSAAASNDDSNDVVLVNVLMNLPVCHFVSESVVEHIITQIMKRENKSREWRVENRCRCNMMSVSQNNKKYK